MKTEAIPKNANQSADLKGRIRSLIAARETGVLLALLVICVLLTFATDSFLTVRNLLNVGRQTSLLGIMAIGMTFVLVSREVDLSVGSTYAISGLVTGMLIVRGFTLIPALCVGLGLGMAIGTVNGILSTYGKLPSFIATLGMLSVVRGAALLITDGQPVTVDTTRGGQPQVVNQFYAAWTGPTLWCGSDAPCLLCRCGCHFLVCSRENDIRLSRLRRWGQRKGGPTFGYPGISDEDFDFWTDGSSERVRRDPQPRFPAERSGRAYRRRARTRRDCCSHRRRSFAFGWRRYDSRNSIWGADHWDSEERACSPEYLSVLANDRDRTRDHLRRWP